MQIIMSAARIGTVVEPFRAVMEFVKFCRLLRIQFTLLLTTEEQEKLTESSTLVYSKHHEANNARNEDESCLIPADRELL